MPKGGVFVIIAISLVEGLLNANAGKKKLLSLLACLIDLLCDA